MKTEELERLVREPLGAENAGTAARVYADRALWPDFERALYPEATPTAEELKAIRQVVTERCADRSALRERLAAFVARRLARMTDDLSGYALAAAARRGGGPSADGAEAEEAVTFVFVSEAVDAGTNAAARWKAVLTLPPAAHAETMLAIDLTEADGGAADGGFFRVAGATLPVVCGRAEIPYGLFLSGLKDAHVERLTPQGGRIPGALALF